jgi:hypothetical protein
MAEYWGVGVYGGVYVVGGLGGMNGGVRGGSKSDLTGMICGSDGRMAPDFTSA